MPNTTLCGKAVVEMLLAQETGSAIQDVQAELVSSGDLPKSYIITKERIERCKKFDSVQMQDQKGIYGVHSLDILVKAQADAEPSVGHEEISIQANNKL